MRSKLWWGLAEYAFGESANFGVWSQVVGLMLLCLAGIWLQSP
jgi:hypothetical protein